MEKPKDWECVDCKKHFDLKQERHYQFPKDVIHGPMCDECSGVKL